MIVKKLSSSFFGRSKYMYLFIYIFIIFFLLLYVSAVLFLGLKWLLDKKLGVDGNSFN